MNKYLAIAAFAALPLCSLGLHGADVREGLVSYWPLSSLQSGGTQNTTPDVAGGNDMVASVDVYPEDFISDPDRGRLVWNCFSEFATYMYFRSPEGEDTGLPISQNPAWTVMIWVKATYPYVVGEPPVSENDRRVFSESSGSDDNPLVNLGTHNQGTDGTVDILIRNGGTQVNHAHSTAVAYDGAWHHLAMAYAEGTLSLFIDGEPDITMNYTPGTTPYDITSVGAILRQWDGSTFGNIGAFFNGFLSELAVWERALTQAEIQDVMNNGIQTPVPSFPPTITADPVGGDQLFGDPYIMSVKASGTRPLSFVWQKNGVEIPGETGPSLAFDSLIPSNSGSYVCIVSNGLGTDTSEAAVLNVSDWPEPDLLNGMLCYWPCDEAFGTKTPDLRSWYDMELVNLDAGSLVPGRWGNCFQFVSTNATLLQRLHQPDDELPIYPHPSFAISLWVKGAIQRDLRVFSEGSTAVSTPLFNIGTHNSAGGSQVDTFIRNDANTTSGHQLTEGNAFDDTWHHIVYVQRTLADELTAVIYIDGVADPNLPAPIRPLTLNTTTIGGIRRGDPSHWFTGLIDDVALWERALSPEEVADLFANGTPVPEARPRPLLINSFVSDLPAVKAGDSVKLSWDVAVGVDVEIDQGVGDVTDQTVFGAGSIEVTVDATTTYTLTLRRDAEQVTAQVTVGAVSGIADNWSLVDNFEQYPAGVTLGDTGWWLDLRASGQIFDAGGNKVLLMPEHIDFGDGAATLPLSRLTLLEGQSRSLFFRVLTPADVNVLLRQFVGITDKNLRWHSDAGESGPKIIIAADGVGGPMQVGTHNGQGITTDEWFAGLAAEPDKVYNVWIDIQNRSIAEGDLFSIYIQEDGDVDRVPLFENYVANRGPDPSAELGATGPDLDKLFVTGTEAATLQFDDFYISNTGFNSTVPRAITVAGAEMAVSVEGGGITIGWSSGTLESTDTIGGTFLPVDGAAAPSYTVTPTDQQRFYRVNSN